MTFDSFKLKKSSFLTGVALALSYEPNPDAKDALLRPYEEIFTVADWLKLKNGSVPTVEELATHLHTSKSTLYRRYPRIMKMIEQRYRTDDLPDGVGATVDLPGGVRAPPSVDFDYDAIDFD
jgi:hypothetical protein